MPTNAKREKALFLLFLQKIYGRVETEYSFKGALPDVVRPVILGGDRFMRILNGYGRLYWNSEGILGWSLQKQRDCQAVITTFLNNR